MRFVTAWPLTGGGENRGKEMTLSAEQYAQMAEGDEKASADPLVPAERRLNVAKEADWFRWCNLLF